MNIVEQLQKMIEIYQIAVDANYESPEMMNFELDDERLDCGICLSADHYGCKDVIRLIDQNDFPEECNGLYIHTITYEVSTIEEKKASLQYRLDFLKKKMEKIRMSIEGYERFHNI